MSRGLERAGRYFRALKAAAGGEGGRRAVLCTPATRSCVCILLGLRAVGCICFVVVLPRFSSSPLLAATLPQQAPHPEKDALFKGDSSRMFAGRFQNFVQRLIQPSCILCRIALVCALLQQVEEQVVLRDEGVVGHHEGHVADVCTHRCLVGASFGNTVCDNIVRVRVCGGWW